MLERPVYSLFFHNCLRRQPPAVIKRSFKNTESSTATKKVQANTWTLADSIK